MDVRQLLFPKSRPAADAERVGGVYLQEQSVGPERPLIERTAAEVLAERQAQVKAQAPAALFVP